MTEELDSAERGSSKVLFLLLGLGVGSLIAFLFAPKSGDEVREFLRKKARSANDYAQEKAQQIQKRAGALVVQGKEAVIEKKQQVTAAVDAGREAYNQEIAKAKATGID